MGQWGAIIFFGREWDVGKLWYNGLNIMGRENGYSKSHGSIVWNNSRCSRDACWDISWEGKRDATSPAARLCETTLEAVINVNVSEKKKILPDFRCVKSLLAATSNM